MHDPRLDPGRVARLPLGRRWQGAQVDVDDYRIDGWDEFRPDGLFGLVDGQRRGRKQENSQQQCGPVMMSAFVEGGAAVKKILLEWWCAGRCGAVGRGEENEVVADVWIWPGR